ncbi:hypothetical protein [Cellulomonas sp. URHD0024]|uniref:hypothetical protein n=1 Tax=Cellulomonas sp. URHD0024 TaxID=1302620 RepID=UPI000482B79A|nr:hypothetical protein [Cellulomonas sp. URHD0024]
MRRIKRLTVLIAAIMAAALFSVGAPTAAQAEAAGNYQYECISSAGAHYFLKPGDALSTCKGSALRTYINGTLIHVTQLTGYGTVAKVPKYSSLQCYYGLVKGMAVVFTWEWKLLSIAASGGKVSSALDKCIA